LEHGFLWGLPSGAQIIFPKSGRGLGRMTPTIFSDVKLGQIFEDETEDNFQSQ